jgi:DNA polymerase-3 subunit beta
MNSSVIHSTESLTALSRKELIAVAREAGIAKPDTTKSVVLIENILATQVAAEVATVAEVEVVEEIAPDNVVAFEPAPPEQIEIEAEIVPAPVSHGLLKVNRKALQRQLSAASKVVNTSRTMPVLACVLIDFADGRLVIEASDLSNHLRTVTPAETTGAHRIAIPYAVLSKFVGRCASEFLMIEAIDSKLVISDLENRTEILGIAAEEFPPAHTGVDTFLMEIGGGQLARVIRETINAASKDKHRYILNGLGIDTTAGYVVTTDGRRLVRALLGADKIEPVANTLILPTRAAQILADGIPQDATTMVNRTFSDSCLRFATETDGFSYTLTCRMVEGCFPNYSQVIPSQSGGEFEIGNPELNEALGRLLVVSNASDSGCAIRFSFETELLTMNVANVSVGIGKETVSVKSAPGDAPRVIALNGNYIAEVIGAWADEKIMVSVKDEVSPLVIRTADKVAVIMPVRVN